MANYKRKDALYQAAKDGGLRSRAHFKLDELNKRHKLLRPGMCVLDLGAWPGGWSEYCAQRVGRQGKVIGIDLVMPEKTELSQIVFLQGDLRDDESLELIKQELQGRPVDLVISDMSPKLTGIREADQAQSVHLAELALHYAHKLLKPEGNFLVKLFKGSESDLFVKALRPMFKSALRRELRSTRKTSKEFYALGMGLLSTQD